VVSRAGLNTAIKKFAAHAGTELPFIQTVAQLYATQVSRLPNKCLKCLLKYASILISLFHRVICISSEFKMIFRTPSELELE
jgi:hypothetical protein